MDYEKKLKNEIERYSDTLNIHDLPDIAHYASNQYLMSLFQEKCGFNSFDELIVRYINQLKKSRNRQIKVVSLGSGNCDTEINLIINNNLDCHFTCYEVNPQMLQRGRDLAKEKNISNQIKFIESDINKFELNEKFDLVIAHHSLHHFENLEHIFDQVDRSMADNSFFIIHDMIGRNGHKYWDDTLDVVNRIWSILPIELKYNHLLKKIEHHRVQRDCSMFCNEGIRAQDILPLLDKHFDFEVFASFYAIANRFIDRDFGHNFKKDNPLHKSYIDMILQLDHYLCQNQLLKPTQMIAVLTKKGQAKKTSYTYFSQPKELYELKFNLYREKFSNVKAPISSKIFSWINNRK